MPSEEDADFALVTELRTAWTEQGEWLKSHGQDAPLAELEARLAEVRKGEADLAAAREERRQQARDKLRSSLGGLMLTFKVFATE